MQASMKGNSKLGDSYTFSKVRKSFYITPNHIGAALPRRRRFPLTATPQAIQVQEGT